MSELVQYLEGHTLEISVILEIGACDGNDTLFYAKTFPTAEIHAFEPRHDNYMKILKKVQDQSLPNVYTYPFALSDKVGEVSFYPFGGFTNLLDIETFFNHFFEIHSHFLFLLFFFFVPVPYSLIIT